MADYYTHFSLVIKLQDPDQQEYALDLAKLADQHRFEDEPPPSFPASLVPALEDWSFETEKQGDGVWLHSEQGGVDAVCAFIQHLLQKFDPKACIKFEWSNDCSKPRTDAYGGGAAIVTAQNVKSMTTHQWLEETKA